MKKPTPETDAVAAYEGNWDTKALRMTAHSRKLERERDELRQWKKEMLLIESQWDEQIVGRLLGLQLGDYIKPNIEPKLRQLIRERDEARDVLEEISLYLSSGIGDENTTAQQYKERILDGVKHLAGHAWEERCKFERERDESREAFKIVYNERVQMELERNEWKNKAYSHATDYTLMEAKCFRLEQQLKEYDKLKS